MLYSGQFTVINWVGKTRITVLYSHMDAAQQFLQELISFIHLFEPCLSWVKQNDFWYFSNALVLLSSFALLDVYHGLAFGKDIKKMPWPLFVEHLHRCLGLPLSVQKDWEKNGS